MSDAANKDSRQHVGERANPSPDLRPSRSVEVIDEAGGQVRVRYINGGMSPWWISLDAWESWKANNSRKWWR